MSPTIVGAMIGFTLGLLAAAAISAALGVYFGEPLDGLGTVELVEMLEQLRAEEGDCVQIYADGAWDRTSDGPVRVVCTGRWTGWEARSFRGADLLHAVRAAHAARYPQMHERGA